MITEDTLKENLPEKTDTAMEEVQAAEASPEETPAQHPVHDGDSDKEKNFRALREKADSVAQERDQLRRELEELRKKPDRDPDDLVEARYVNEKIKELEQKMYYTSTESRLKSEHPDIDQVVTEANFKKLVKKEPEIAAAIHSSSDYYNKAKAAYKAIRQFGILSENDNKVDRERVQNNAAKPRPGASLSPQAGDSPLSRANAFAEGLTDDLKKQLWKEMVDSRRKS